MIWLWKFKRFLLLFFKLPSDPFHVFFEWVEKEEPVRGWHSGMARWLMSLLIKPIFSPLYSYSCYMPFQNDSLAQVSHTLYSLFNTTAGESEVIRTAVQTVTLHVPSPLHLDNRVTAWRLRTCPLATGSRKLFCVCLTNTNQELP